MVAAPKPPPVGTRDVLPRSLRGWWRFGKAVWQETAADNVLLLAAGVAFFAFVSIFPTLLATGLVYGLVAENPEQVEAQVGEFSDVLPPGAAELIANQLGRLVAASDESLSIGLIVALVVALWGASTATSNLIGAVNACYEHTARRSFVRRRALAIAMTVGGIIFITLSVGLVAVLPAVINALDLPTWVQVIRWSVFVIGVLAALGVLYRVAPFRAGVDMRWTSLGAIVAMLLWVAASAGFSLYVSQFGTNYESTYGQLAGVIVLLFWLWFGAIAALLGAEVNAELARRRKATA